MNIFIVILAIVGGAIVLPVIGWLLWKAVWWVWFGVTFAVGFIGILIDVLIDHWRIQHRREVITFRDGWGNLHRVYKD